jgi:hypothetical protein
MPKGYRIEWHGDFDQLTVPRVFCLQLHPRYAASVGLRAIFTRGRGVALALTGTGFPLTEFSQGSLGLRARRDLFTGAGWGVATLRSQSTGSSPTRCG